MNDAIDEALELTRALLSQTNMTFQEGAPALSAEALDAIVAWGFTTRKDTIAADVYLYDDYQAIQTALAQLRQHYGAGPSDLLPAISQNGSLVFVVRLLASGGDGKDVSAALDVASALAGEEE